MPLKKSFKVLCFLSNNAAAFYTFKTSYSIDCKGIMIRTSATRWLAIFTNVAKSLFRLQMLPNTRRLRRFLGNTRLFIADIGATRGAAGTWHEIQDFSRFALFDPDPRASIGLKDQSATIYPIGLWSTPCKRSLHLAQNPEASSVYELNKTVLDDYLNAYMHTIVDTTCISLDSLYNVLGDTTIDFIKVDAEGADLEVLKGAEPYLRGCCLGVLVEVSFAERHKGAPLFCDTDEYMRRQQFMLANLHPSHWIRSNGVFDMFSQPQVIWSNALYLLGREVFLNRLKMCPAGHRKHLLSKFLIILLLYRFHDYACEIVFHARSRDLISAVTSSEATAFINAARRNGYLNIVKLILGTLSAVVALVVFLPIRQFRGSSIAFLKIQLSELCMVLLQFARCRLHGSLVDPSDPTVRL